MKILQIIFFVSCLTLASCLRYPSIFPKAKPMRYFLGDFRSPGQTKNSELAVPNEKICAEMQLLQSERLVLPWWYTYCASMYENQEMKHQEWMYENMGVHKSVLNEIDAYQRGKERQNHNMI